MAFLIGDMLFIILLNMDGHNTVKVRNCWGNTEKSTCESKCFFQLNPPMAEEIPLSWDEIAARRNPASQG